MITLGAAVYVGCGGRARFSAEERPGRVVGRRAQLTDLESGLRGFDPAQPHLPPAVVERFVPGATYVLRFEAPILWLGKPETHATVAARHVGYPISLAAKPWQRRVTVVGQFGSGEAFIGELRII